MMFSSIVGQEKLKAAYIANIVNPSIGGLLVMGPKGSGKSTIVHSVEDILPDYKTVMGCAFNCIPDEDCDYCGDKSSKDTVEKQMRVITLPLSCTEDRLIGSIDIELLMKEGKKQVIPGILGLANRNILYVDEVNLLPDHLVDDILDAAASHINIIEREGVSITHRSDFVLIGSMNPEEGELRPQILDRFPLAVKVETITDPAKRAEIVKRNLLFEDDYKAYLSEFSDQQEKVRNSIPQARKKLGDVTVTDEQILSVSSACGELKVDGQRPDIVIIKTARTLAALRDSNYVTNADIEEASTLALIHRTRDGGLLGPPEEEEILQVLSKHLPEEDEDELDKQPFIFEMDFEKRDSKKKAE